jgi:uncharacterized repeat protein (TIGR01451 family)
MRTKFLKTLLALFVLIGTISFSKKSIAQNPLSVDTMYVSLVDSCSSILHIEVTDSLFTAGTLYTSLYSNVSGTYNLINTYTASSTPNGNNGMKYTFNFPTSGTGLDSLVFYFTGGFYNLSQVVTYSPSYYTPLLFGAVVSAPSCDSFQLCLNQTSGSAITNYTVSTVAFTNNIFNGSSLCNFFAYNNAIIGQTTFSITATNANGCVQTVNPQVTLLGKINATASKDTICYGDSTSLSVNFIQGGSYGTLGTSIASSSFDEDIVGVSFGTFNNASSCSTTGGGAANGQPASVLNRYSNYTNLFTPIVYPGNTVSVTVNGSSCGGAAFQAGVAIFVDLNNNGIWDLPAERVSATTNTIAFPSSPLSNAINLNFTLPLGVSYGSRLMRVIAMEATAGTNILPTTIYNWGETEDYTLNIGSQNNWYDMAGNNLGSAAILNVSPKVTTTYFTLNSNPGYCNDTIFKTIYVKDSLAGLTVTSNVINANCALSSDGSIAIGITPLSLNPLTYSWQHNSGLDSNMAVGLPVGSYGTTITNSIGQCVTVYNTIGSSNTNCGNLTGYVKEDMLQNCLVDTNDAGLANIPLVVTPGGFLTFTDAAGYYQVNGLPFGTYTVTQNNTSWAINHCINNTSFTLNATNPNFDYEFLDTVKQFNDFNIYGWNGCIVPGNDSGTNFRNIHINNGSFNGINATVYVKLDSFQYYTYSNPAPSFINGDTLFYTINTANNFLAIAIHYNVPLAALGNTMTNRFGILSFYGIDSNLTNNHDTATHTFCASYDPNDKAVSPQGKTSNGYIKKEDETLSYLIRFQNTGNAPATHVIIHDSLSDKLDLTTFQVTAYSHPYQIEIKNNKLIKFKFLNIMLPDSGTDYNGSQGYVAFTAKQKASNVLGDVITNTAYIYFDNNPAIVTNTTLNTLYKPLQAGSSSFTNNTICNTTCGNGTITFNGTNGVAPYTYSINPILCSATTLVGGNTYNNLAGGTYAVTIKDALGDEIAISNTLTAPTPIVANLTVTQASGGVWGAATVNPIGGTAPYITNWAPIGKTGNAVNNLQAGTYTVTIADAGGCLEEKVFTINIPTNVKDIDLANGITIYPNPTNDVLYINSQVPMQDIVLYNTLGQVALRVNVTSTLSTSISTKTLSNGTYVIAINGVKTKRIVKTN